MDQVLKDTLTANLKAAKTNGAKLDALVLSEIAVIDCQHKTSARVKAYGAKIYPRWLRDDELGVIHDRDAAEIRRRNLGPLGFPTP